MSNPELVGLLLMGFSKLSTLEYSVKENLLNLDDQGILGAQI